MGFQTEKLFKTPVKSSEIRRLPGTSYCTSTRNLADGPGLTIFSCTRSGKQSRNTHHLEIPTQTHQHHDQQQRHQEHHREQQQEQHHEFYHHRQYTISPPTKHGHQQQSQRLMLPNTKRGGCTSYGHPDRLKMRHLKAGCAYNIEAPEPTFSIKPKL